VRNFVTSGEGISHIVTAASMPDFGTFLFRPAGSAKIARKIIQLK
jgi:hypothetical protein